MKKPKINRSGFADLMLLIGFVAISIGVGMIHIPAGVITSGLLCVVCGVLEGLGGD